MLFTNIIFSQSNENLVTRILYDSTYQVTINPNLPHLTGIFKITALQNRNTYSSIYNLRFVNSSNNSLYTEVIDTVYDFSYWPDFELIDVNFDDFLDLWTVIDRDVKAQESYHFWIFNPQKKSFEINQEFSDSLVCNLYLVPEDSTISSGCSGGCMGMCGSESTYKIINNHLLLIETSETEEVEINGEWKYKSTTHKLINGEWQIVKEDYLDHP